MCSDKLNNGTQITKVQRECRNNGYQWYYYGNSDKYIKLDGISK